jgi:type VI secretion system protein ImpL
MWLWILSALFLALVWTAWWFLQPPEGVPGDTIFPLWLALAITGVVVIALIALVIVRRVRAARAARALEKAIAQQAQEQVVAAKPEDRAEIQELQRQLLDGIKALKASRLGEGDALYSLPWYAIVGPPGAGKTTALRHSGLSFPYLDPDGAGVKGSGGTRNCDWWFTNDAILLDTAGRYTTEQDDHDEWMAFLNMLKTYRKDKPLNGIIVAVSISELIDATEEEIQGVAERVRDRIDEMQVQLQMIMPVYVLFTKTDLVAGFVEFFGNLKRSDRGQPWGATFPLATDKANPGGLFDSEFDQLVEALHKRSIRRINTDRPTRAEREKIYQFPLEFAAIKRNLSEFMGACFRPAPPRQGRKDRRAKTPILRGFYFTSGTQEGKPLDRVVGAMGRAFGLRPVEAETDAPKESKSFFLKEVFTSIIFPDADIAGRTDEEINRVRWQKVLIAAAACIFAAILLVPAIFSYLNNRDLIDKTEKIARDTDAIDWEDKSTDPVPKIEQLDLLRAHVEDLDFKEQNGAEIGLRWGSMYVGDDLLPKAREQYVASLCKAFVNPAKDDLEKQLTERKGKRDADTYNNLKTYLLLDDVVHIQEYRDYEIDKLLGLWATLLRSDENARISEGDLREKLSKHVVYFVDLLAREVRPNPTQPLVKYCADPENRAPDDPSLDPGLIESTRDDLSRVGPSQRYYDLFITVLEDEKIDPAGSSTKDNLAFPYVTLDELFEDRPDVLRVLTSKRVKREGQPQKVRGPYTLDGHKRVLTNLKEGYQRIEREQWVVPLTVEEKRQPGKIKEALERVRQDYDAQYIKEWMDFFRDIDTKIPYNNVESIEEFKILATPDWPYWRLLRVLRDNTQFEDEKAAAEKAAADGGVADQLRRKVQQRVDAKLRAPGASSAIKEFAGVEEAERKDPVPEKFKLMVAFGFPTPPKEGEPPPPGQLSEYVGYLEGLAGEMTIIEEGPTVTDTKKATELFETAVKDTEGKLLRMDKTGQELMTELLMNPLRQAYKAALHSAGGAASGLWEVVVWPPYRDQIKSRFPFNAAAKRDASYEDMVAWFAPKTGTLWGFYEEFLKGFHRQQGHKFFPSTSLSGQPRPARPYAPFRAEMYPCLERAHEITEALFGNGEEPKLKFKVNLTTVSPIVSEIIFELDGSKRLYRNEKEFWHDFEWPGAEKALEGAAISIRGAGGLNEEIRREGPWGLWRLLESGRHTAAKDDDNMFRVEWDMSAPPVTVKMTIKPTRANHPFPRNFFRDTNCPPSIGDAFGPGG